MMVNILLLRMELSDTITPTHMTLCMSLGPWVGVCQMTWDGITNAKSYTRVKGIWRIMNILVWREYKERWYKIATFEVEKVVKEHVYYDQKSELYSRLLFNRVRVILTMYIF